MTTKERLHRLVDLLDEKQAVEALTLLENQYADAGRVGGERPLPSWVGMFRSGRSDLSERHEEILRDKIGRTA